MRELIGYLVARGGAEDAAARMAAGISQRIPGRQFVCRHFLCKQVDIAIGETPGITRAPAGSASTDGILTANIRTGSSGTSSPITIIYCRENFTDHAIEGTTAAIPDLSVFDCGSRAAQAASAGARRT
jgi:hypothetical protein